MHQAGLFGEIAVELGGTCIAAPPLDAEEGCAAGLRPDAELAESVPGDVERGSRVGGEPRRRAGGMIEDHRIVVEQSLRQGELPALDWARLGRGAQQAVLEA